jgi:transcriptional regulator
MYIPKAFDEPDRSVLLDFIRAQPFATLISHRGGIQVSHVPLYPVQEGGKDWLVGHLARQNPQAESLDGDAVAIFHGPHAYVSWRWYGTRDTVPTWNYVAVHASGPLAPAPPEALESILDLSLKAQGEDPALLKANMTGNFFDTLSRHILGFRLEVRSLEGKWKLSQNKPALAQAKIAQALAASGDWNARRVADLMLAKLAGHAEGAAPTL